MCSVNACQDPHTVITLNCGHSLCNTHARACALQANSQMFSETRDEALGRRQPPDRFEPRGWGRCPACGTALTSNDYSSLEDRYIT